MATRTEYIQTTGGCPLPVHKGEPSTSEMETLSLPATLQYVRYPSTYITLALNISNYDAVMKLKAISIGSCLFKYLKRMLKVFDLLKSVFKFMLNGVYRHGLQGHGRSELSAVYSGSPHRIRHSYPPDEVTFWTDQLPSLSQGAVLELFVIISDR